MGVDGDMKKEIIAGIDLGGTKILTGLFSEEGSLLEEKIAATFPEQGFGAVVEKMAQSVEGLMDQRQGEWWLKGLAVASPGPLDCRTGVVYEAPNLGWKAAPLGQALGQRLGVPVWVENDANLAALGECRFGYPGLYSVMLYVTVSTGVGGGIIIDDQIYRGADGGAGEFGHMTILPDGPICGCGNYGCLEALASGKAVAARAREGVDRGECLVIAEEARRQNREIDGRMVSEMAVAGDAEACRIMDQALGYLGIGIANLVNLFNPQTIVVGGGMANHPGLLAAVREVVDRRAFKHLTDKLEILPSRLGYRAGLMGCLAYSRMMINK